jgi:hypothetical protein
MYFSGALISAGVLYVLPHDLSDHSIQQTYRIIGVTLFTGIIALFFTAREKKRSVVYLERKEKEARKQTSAQSVEESSVLSDVAIATIVNSRENVPQRILNELCTCLGAGQGAIYTRSGQSVDLKYGYAVSNEIHSISYNLGEGLVGRVAAEGNSLYLDDVPKGYITVFSGLGNISPTRLAVVPVMTEGKVKGVIEIATFSSINEPTLRHLERVGSAIASAIN